jgi:hypothetical protein
MWTGVSDELIPQLIDEKLQEIDLEKQQHKVQRSTFGFFEKMVPSHKLFFEIYTLKSWHAS